MIIVNRIIETDVLVVGGGGAGFRAAIGARQKGVKVTLLSKGPLARCGASPMAGADFTMAGIDLSRFEGLNGDPEDTPDKTMNDIITQGWFLNNQRLVEQYIRVAPQVLGELIEWGTKIDRSDQRAIYTSGIGIMDALLKKARTIGVDLLEDVFLLDIVTSDGAVAGGIGLDVRSGEVVLIRTKAIVMATGGWHKAFWPNTGMRDLSGEGIAMAHRAGADLGNMEFITFCCNVFLSPPIWKGSIAPYILSLMLGGGRLANSAGEQFLQKYDPFVAKVGSSTEWNKSFISCMTAKEVRSGKGSPNGGVYYSRGDIPWKTVEETALKKYPSWRYKAIDLSEWARMLENNEPVEVGPAVEYFDGGIVVNDRFETTLKGLYAAGECTLGVFGANRVFSAITEMLVHGADAGAYAGDYAKVGHKVEFGKDIWRELQAKAEEPLRRERGLNPAQVRRKVQEEAHRHLGPVRNQQELQSFLGFLDRVKKDQLPNLATTSKSRIYNKEWLDALELENIVQLLEIAANSALVRTESRGVHYREDYPIVDNERWLMENIVHRAGEHFTISQRPVTTTSMELPAGKVPYLEFMKKLMESRSNTGGKH